MKDGKNVKLGNKTNDKLNFLSDYESPDFVDLDEVYGFSQSCTSGTANKNCKSPCGAGM